MSVPTPGTSDVVGAASDPPSAPNIGHGGSDRVAIEIGGKAYSEVNHVERRESVQLAVVLDVQLRLPIAQDLQRRAEGTARPQCALRDRALDPELARRQSHDLRRVAVAERGEDDGGGGDEGHD